MKPYLINVVLAFGAVFGAQAVIYVLTLLLGDQCWPPRVGGIMVGLAVFLQGVVYAHGDLMQRRLRAGITLEQRVLHVVYFASVFGTFLWALGDFLPPIFGIEFCRK